MPKRGIDGSVVSWAAKPAAKPPVLERPDNGSKEGGDEQDLPCRPRSLAVGAQVEALDVQELWYPARIEEVKGKSVRVSFDGWGSQWDEWLLKTSPRLREHRGWGTAARPDDWQQDTWIEALDMEGKWYRARVLHVSETAVMVHYSAWSSKWDEWVDKTSGRLRVSGSGAASGGASGGANGGASGKAKRQEQQRTQQLQAPASRQDTHEDVCAVCEEPGQSHGQSRLLCCEGKCKRGFHAKCVPSNNPPPEEEGERWVCADCRCKRFRCFLCKRWGAERLTVHRCGRKACGKAYHAECLVASLHRFPGATLPPFPEPPKAGGGEALALAVASAAAMLAAAPSAAATAADDEGEEGEEEGGEEEVIELEAEEAVDEDDDEEEEAAEEEAEAEEEEEDEEEGGGARLRDSPPPEGWLTSGHRWVGRRVRRFFELEGDFFDGTVSRWLPADGEDEPLWHMVHDDGDEEDLEEFEMRRALVSYTEGWEREMEETAYQAALARGADEAKGRGGGGGGGGGGSSLAAEPRCAPCDDNDDDDDTPTQQAQSSSPAACFSSSSPPATPTRVKPTSRIVGAGAAPPSASSTAAAATEAATPPSLFGAGAPRARKAVTWAGVTCARHWCVACDEPESLAYGRAMLSCVRCPAAVHRVCAPLLAHIPITAKTFLCVRCSECSPRGLNAPDPVMPSGRSGRVASGYAEALPELPSDNDEGALAGVSFASLGKGPLGEGGKGPLKAMREFEPPEEVLEALKRNEIVPTRDFAPPPYAVIRRSVYMHKGPRERLDEDDVMVCHCTADSGGCEERCPNRAMQHECNPKTCPCGEACANRPLSTLPPVASLPLQLFKTLGKGWGVKATSFFKEGDLVVEYVGEVIDMESWEARKRELGRYEHMYFMALNGNEIVDASRRGNIARFINHSCNPNLQVEKWYVNRTPRLAMWAKRPIAPGEELSYNYSVKWTGNLDHATRCFCGAPNCTGYLGRAPKK